jgi:CRISPR-associated protein Cas1
VSFHIINIDQTGSDLTCRDGNLVCSTASSIKSVPLEDVASIVVTAFSANFSSALFVEAAKAGVSVVLCERYKPVAILMPASRATDTLLTRAQFSLTAKQREQLWRSTVDAKCANQHHAALNLGASRQQAAQLDLCARGHKPFKEAACARLFWSLFAKIAVRGDFRREPRMQGVNSLLNYGYAIVLSVVLRNLFAVGIDPTFGIAHRARERAAALAYDVIEPFRPCVDEFVGRWLLQNAAANTEWKVTSEFKQWVTSVCNHPLSYRGARMPLVSVVELTVRSLRRAILTKQPSLYRPWISTNTKWAG